MAFACFEHRSCASALRHLPSSTGDWPKPPADFILRHASFRRASTSGLFLSVRPPSFRPAVVQISAAMPPVPCYQFTFTDTLLKIINIDHIDDEK